MFKKLKKFLKESNWIIRFLMVLVIINIVFMILIMFKSKQSPNKMPFVPEQNYEIQQINFSESPCPDLEMHTIKGKPVFLPDLAGDVIVLRFTRFNKTDIPYLIFLEHLYEKYKNHRMHLFLINLLQKTHTVLSNKPIESSVPIIDDDGYVSGPFQARLNDTIIIGRDFKIKFKSNQGSNSLIFDQICRHLFEKSMPPASSPKEEIESLLKMWTSPSFVDIPKSLT